MSILAYIDPGAGSLVIQALIAGLLSVPFFFRRAIRTGLQRLRGSRPSDAHPDESGSDTE